MMQIENGILTLKDKSLSRTWQRSFVFVSAAQFPQACRDSILDLFRDWNAVEAGESDMEMTLEINGIHKKEAISPTLTVQLGTRDVLGSKLYKTLAVDFTSFINGVYDA